MRIMSVMGFPNKGEPERRKGVETGDIARDGYRVTARATDDYRKEMRRCIPPSFNNIFEPCEQGEDD